MTGGCRSKRRVASEGFVKYGFFMSERELLLRITSDPGICHGKPCIRGLRYPVEIVLEWLSSGMTHAEILADYEDLEETDLLAAAAWAARLVRTKRIEPVVG
jgi:uncharacterized protein (DUF433 family)